MDQSLENKIKFKDKLINFCRINKFKIYSLILIFTLIAGSLIFIKYKNEKQNIQAAEKYIEAGIYLTSKEKTKAILIYEEIILSRNKFYSILALNTILEKNLISDKEKIFEYFKILEKNIKSEEQRDLLILKKALYLIKEAEVQRGNNLLKELIDKNSSLKTLAEELIKK